MQGRLAFALAMVAACSSRQQGVYDGLVIDPPTLTLTVPLGGSATQGYHVFGTTGSGRTDITSTCSLAVDPAFGAFAGAMLTVGPHGGKTLVHATCGTAGAIDAQLAVQLAGAVVVMPAPSNAPDLFGNATLGMDPTRSPAIEYPLDQAVSPRNIPPIEIQWTAASDDLFHITLVSAYAQIDVYTTDVQATLSPADWDAITGTAAGDVLAFSVEGLAQAMPSTKYAGTSVGVTMSRDSIDKTAIYFWASSVGDIMTQTFGAVTAPSVVQGGCTSCHSLSRTGTRIGYSRCVNGDCNTLYAGFMHYDPLTGTWPETANADGETIHGSFTTFSPLGYPYASDDNSLAIVSMVNGTLSLYDPDSGSPIASNLDAISTHGPNAPRSGLMADWAPNGMSVVYASTPHPGQWIDLSDSSIAVSSYTYTQGVHVFGEPQFIIAAPIALSGGTYSNFFFPSYSPDGALIVFDAARSAWRDGNSAYNPAARLMLADAGGTWVKDLAALNGGTNVDNTWSHWAPTISSDYYWIVYSSERDYGHELTTANTNTTCKNVGVVQCKQIWIGAIAKDRLAAGNGDPSAPPMWMPGQDVHTDNISPYWTVPAGIQ